MRCGSRSYEEQIVKRFGNPPLKEYAGSGGDFPVFQVVDPLHCGCVLFPHAFEVQHENRFVQLPECVFQRAGLGSRQGEDVQLVFPGRVRTFVEHEPESLVIVSEPLLQKRSHREHGTSADVQIVCPKHDSRIRILPHDPLQVRSHTAVPPVCRLILVEKSAHQSHVLAYPCAFFVRKNRELFVSSQRVQSGSDLGGQFRTGFREIGLQFVRQHPDLPARRGTGSEAPLQLPHGELGKRMSPR